MFPIHYRVRYLFETVVSNFSVLTTFHEIATKNLTREDPVNVLKLKRDGVCCSGQTVEH